MTERYYLQDEAAEVLRQKPTTLAYWRSRGEGPEWFKMGRRVVYAESALQAFINDAQARDRADAV